MRTDGNNQKSLLGNAGVNQESSNTRQGRRFSACPNVGDPTRQQQQQQQRAGTAHENDRRADGQELQQQLPSSPTNQNDTIIHLSLDLLPSPLVSSPHWLRNEDEDLLLSPMDEDDEETLHDPINKAIVTHTFLFGFEGDDNENDESVPPFPMMIEDTDDEDEYH